jgi:uncharacterized protein YceH (UPF0502 family)
MSIEPDAVEIRILGCLVEKQRTTPDQYPLSVNALRNACNQSTNRDPVMDLDEQTVIAGLESLSRRGWVRLASGAGSRARKYRHLIDTELSLEPDEIAIVSVLMLRGPQTPGELKARTERLQPFAGLEQVDALLEQLIGRELVARLERRPGQKEVRYAQLVGGAEDAEEVPGASGEAPVASSQERPPEDRLARVERELTELRDEIRTLRAQLSPPGPRHE